MRSPRRPPKVELIPTVGYISSGSLSTGVGRLDLEDGLVYGGTLAFRAGGGKSILVNYVYFGTDLKATDRLPIAPDTVLGGMAQHNITIGGEQDLKAGHARPFVEWRPRHRDLRFRRARRRREARRGSP